MRLISFMLMAAMACYAQAPVFEVASIKPNTTGSRMSVESSGDRFTAFNIGLGPLVLLAYDLNVRQISGLDHAFGYRYDSVAKAGRPVRSAELRQMLQSLLADRFKLHVHWETRKVPVYSLTVAKGGAKLGHSEQQPEGDIPPVRTPDRAGGKETPSGVTYAHESMADFAWALSRMAGVGDRQVVDNTGLDGQYDFTLTFDRNPVSSAGTDPMARMPDILSALKEQLGLKLEPGNAPIRFLVIDHVERPWAN